MNRKYICIEEGIYDIKTKSSIRTAEYSFDGEKMTRKLFILGDKKWRNDKIDVIDSFSVSIKDILNLTPDEIITSLKKKISSIWDINLDEEIKWFKYPIIKNKDE